MVTYAKISPKSGEPQRFSWGTQKNKKNQKEIIGRDCLLAQRPEVIEWNFAFQSKVIVCFCVPFGMILTAG